MKNLLLLLLFPLALHAQVYQIYPGEYDNWVRHPKTKMIFDVVASSTTPVSGFPQIADGDGKGSASLHTAGFIGTDGYAYVWGDNACNISGLGLKAATLGATKTAIGNARQIVAYANSGDGSGQGLGYGFAVVTNDDKLTLIGNTQSGFRGDGTEGNMAEPGPYQVPLTKAISKVAIGSFIYVIYKDGTVDSWGGTRLQYHPTYVLGRGVDNPDPTRPGAMKFPEAIIDIQGGGEWTLFKGVSGAIYGVAYNTRYLGLGPNVPGQNTPFNLTKALGLPGIPVQIAVGTQASYALMATGDLFAWGDNTQAAVGNGQEATFSNYVAPWGGGALWVDKPVKVNPAGVQFVKVFANIGDAFYAYAEDTNGNLWDWGRNKGYVLWNGQGGTDNAQYPNKWDVLSPTKITGFGPIATIPPPPVNKAPIAVISSVQSLTWPANGLQLDGSLSADSDGTIISYRWSVSGAAISDTTTRRPIVLFPGPGTYYITLTVTDNSGTTGWTQIAYTVNPAPAPIVCPVCPAQRTVTGATIHINGVAYSVPASWLTITYSDGSTQ